MPGTNETSRRFINTFFSLDDLERRAAKAEVKRDPLTVAIDRHIAERDIRTACSRSMAHEATELPAGEATVA
ncbi:MAG: hypothetical protein WBO95_09410 [Candidatus Dechloromonas phosphoritropha]|jgi:type I restriction enzyme R subunit